MLEKKFLDFIKSSLCVACQHDYSILPSKIYVSHVNRYFYFSGPFPVNPSEEDLIKNVIEPGLLGVLVSQGTSLRVEVSPL